MVLRARIAKLFIYFVIPLPLIVSISKFIQKLIKKICNEFGKRIAVFTADVGQETGILAINLIVHRRLHYSERIFWFMLFLASMSGAITLSQLQLNRYFKSPSVISVDRDYRDWTGYLPACTLCYMDHIDSFKANDYIQDHWNVSIVDEEYFYFMDFLYAVVNATANNYGDLARFAEDERFDDIDLYDLVRSVERPFEQVLTTFDIDFEVHAVPVMTERGSCYAINSPISAVLTGENKKLEFKDLTQPIMCKFGKQQCFIKMDLFESVGSIDVHSPYEVSATDASVIVLLKSHEVLASFRVMETVASKNLRDLSVEQRKCVFHDEETSQLKVYSKTLCLVRCRAIMALEMCNCVPFFYPFVDGPACNPAGFECLLDFKWPIWALHICKCPSTCTEVEYTTQIIKKSSWGSKGGDEGTRSDVATSSFRWDVIPPKVRLRRDVVFSFEDLLVSFGGALALCIGISLISVNNIAFVLIIHTLEFFFDIIIGLYRISSKFCLRLWLRHFRRFNLKISKTVNIPDDDSLKPEFEYVN